MNVSRIINKNIRNILGVSMLGICTWGIVKSRSIANQEIQIYKTEIKKHNPQKFESLLNNEKEKVPTTRVEYWRSAYESMQDSIKKEGIIRKAYFEGAQMVRDSINRAKSE